MLSFLFSLLKSFYKAGSVVQGPFRKFCKLFFSMKLRSFLLRQRAGKKYVTGLGARKVKPFQRSFPRKDSAHSSLAQGHFKQSSSPQPRRGKASRKRKRRRGGSKSKDTAPVAGGGIGRGPGSLSRVQRESFGPQELKKL